MAISFPSTSVNNDVSFFLDFEGMLPRDQAAIYREDLLVFRDKTDKATVSVADNGGGFLQALNSNQLYAGNGGYLSTTYNSALQLGTNPYTIEFIFLIPASRASITESILSVGATAASNNWEIGIDNLGRPFFIHGTTTETATSATITDDVLQHIAIVRTGTGSNETKMYLNGIAVRTFTDDTDYNYTDGLYIGSGRAGSGATQAYFKNVRISTVARYTEDFTAPNSFSYVAIDDTYSYLDNTYKWNGVKWFDRSKYNTNLPGEYRNYAAVSGSANTTTLDLRSANFFEVNLVGGIDTEIVFENEALSQSFFVQLNGNPLSEGWIPIDEASYTNESFTTVSQQSDPRGVSFKTDGTKMYIAGVGGTSRVYEYNLSTPWSISSASYSGLFFSHSAQDTLMYGITFKSDGTKMYLNGATSTSKVYEYNLSTPWLISSASYSGLSFTISTQDGTSFGVVFKLDGSKMYMVGASGDRVYEYNLSTPWLISSASYSGLSFSVAGQDTLPISIIFKSDGTKMYLSGVQNSRVYEYNLSTPWLISSASYSGLSFSVAGQDGSNRTITFKPDGSKMYMVGQTTRRVYQYNTSESITATITWPSNVTWSTGTAPSITGTTLIEFYKYNGTWHGNVITETL